MNNCRKCRSMFIDALYSELNQEQKTLFERHVQSCPKCAEEYAKFSAAARMMNKRSRTEPDPVFWNGYWDKLADRLETESKSDSKLSAWWKRIWQNIHFEPAWTYRIATAVALIAIGVLIGKLYFGRPVSRHVESVQTAQAPSTAVEQVSLQQRTDRYIERSKILLLGLVNFDPEKEDVYALDLPYQKQISTELVQEANVLKEELNEPAQRQLRELVGDLEVILLQIANLESEYNLEGIDLVKSGVERRGILLKINLEEMQENRAPNQIHDKKEKI